MSETEEMGPLSPKWAITLGVLLPLAGTVIIMILVIATNNSN